MPENNGNALDEVIDALIDPVSNVENSACEGAGVHDEYYAPIILIPIRGGHGAMRPGKK
jgi:hypothetical protein